MRILLDTNIAIFSIIKSERLTEEVKAQLENLDNEVYISIASIWELAIKAKKKPESFPFDEKMFIDYCIKTNYTFLPITIKHILNLRNLKTIDESIIHNDPFDNIIVSQSISENLTLYTSDHMLKNYNTNNNIIII